VIRLDASSSPFLSSSASLFVPPVSRGRPRDRRRLLPNRPSTGLCVIVPRSRAVRCAHVRAGEALATRARSCGKRPRRRRSRRPACARPPAPRLGRECERRLGSRPSISLQAGLTKAPVGQRLHAEATRLARALVASQPRVRCSRLFPTRSCAPCSARTAFGRVARGAKSPGVLGALRVRRHPRRVIAALYGALSAPIAARLTASRSATSGRPPSARSPPRRGRWAGHACRRSRRRLDLAGAPPLPCRLGAGSPIVTA
jgi:hypothetical protein